jgi:isocitrate dehydrogenase
MNNRIAIAYGDGIGPEIMESVLNIFKAAKINLSIDVIEVGENLYK